jgi:hypothetical protein
MQNRYFGDIGDFGKYGMLRAVLNSGLRLGVNWYLYPDENHNDDGKHTRYLEKDIKNVASCDAELYSFLKQNKNIKERSVRAIEESTLLGDTAFYSDYLYCQNEADWKKRLEFRKNWHEKSIKAFKETDVVFYDPDNGFEVPSVSPTSKSGGKYVLLMK